jgi:hypothetical protein
MTNVAITTIINFLDIRILSKHTGCSSPLCADAKVSRRLDLGKISRC